MGDQEEQTVRVRPPRAGPGSRGGVWGPGTGRLRGRSPGMSLYQDLGLPF